jgi:hypothetical protein
LFRHRPGGVFPNDVTRATDSMQLEIGWPRSRGKCLAVAARWPRAVKLRSQSSSLASQLGGAEALAKRFSEAFQRSSRAHWAPVPTICSGFTDLARVLCRPARSNRVCHMQQRSPETLQTASCGMRNTTRVQCLLFQRGAGEPAARKACGCMKRTLARLPPHFASTPSLISLPPAVSAIGRAG